MRSSTSGSIALDSAVQTAPLMSGTCRRSRTAFGKRQGAGPRSSDLWESRARPQSTVDNSCQGEPWLAYLSSRTIHDTEPPGRSTICGNAELLVEHPCCRPASPRRSRQFRAIVEIPTAGTGRIRLGRRPARGSRSPGITSIAISRISVATRHAGDQGFHHESAKPSIRWTRPAGRSAAISDGHRAVAEKVHLIFDVYHPAITVRQFQSSALRAVADNQQICTSLRKTLNRSRGPIRSLIRFCGHSRAMVPINRESARQTQFLEHRLARCTVVVAAARTVGE